VTITYNFGQIADVSTAIHTFQNRMDQDLQDLYTAFTQLFASDWNGAAGQACDEARQKWNQGAEEIRGALNAVGIKRAGSSDRRAGVDRQLASGM
jgi:WXG100 family type VII secretion target